MAATKRVYVGNLSVSVTKEELSNLFGLEATPYLRSSCWVELACKQSGESKGFAFVNVPEHIAQELLKFNGIEFYGRPLQIEPAKAGPEDDKDKDKSKDKEGEDKEKDDKKKKQKPRGRPSNRGGGGYYRGGYRGGRGGGQFRRGQVRSKFNLPVLAADQVYQMIDGGVNLVNGNKFNMSRLVRGVRGRRLQFRRGPSHVRRGPSHVRPPPISYHVRAADEAYHARAAEQAYHAYHARAAAQEVYHITAPDQMYDLVDGGVHLTSGKFAQNTDYVIARALASGVQKMVVTGNRLNGSRSAVVMSKTRPNILYAAIGIHPHHVKDDWNDFTISVLEDLIKLPEVVAVGEVGLDFNRNFTPREQQKKAFEKQVELACRVQKPLLVHDRDAHESVIEVLEKYKTTLPSVVIHCFTGGADEVKAYISRGYYIGITGYLCKEKYGKPLRDALEQGVLPLDKICVQTDAPYMIPNMPKADCDPVSQKLLGYCNEGCNEPCTLSVIVKCIAHCLGKDPKDVAEVLTETARNIFNFVQKEGIDFEK